MGIKTEHKKKPWLSPKQQVEHLKSKGVKFNLLSENEAESYLTKNNNYFRLRSYRTGFSKVEEGTRVGQYANLDFKMLVDLSIIDMLLRYTMLPITLDIEHFSKVELLNKIEEKGEDGYAIVKDFLDNYDIVEGGTAQNRVKEDIVKGKSSPYVANLLAKFPQYDFPVWAFFELIPFGTYTYFYKFCADRFNDKGMTSDFYLLQSVKSLRNACAHNNCILNDMSSGKPMHKPQYVLSQAIGSIKRIGKGQRQSRLSNDRLQQIATSLYLHHKLASTGVRQHRAESLATFTARMNKHLDYYKGNDQITSSFDFITKLVQAWFCNK